jgi:hypothetical protein
VPTLLALLEVAAGDACERQCGEERADHLRRLPEIALSLQRQRPEQERHAGRKHDAASRNANTSHQRRSGIVSESLRPDASPLSRESGIILRYRAVRLDRMTSVTDG